MTSKRYWFMFVVAFVFMTLWNVIFPHTYLSGQFKGAFTVMLLTTIHLLWEK